MTRVLLSATMLAFAACVPSAPGVERAAILGGQIDTVDPAVGMLEFASGRLGTGTLIAPNVVLTAGHVVGGSITAFFTGTGIPSSQLVNTTSSPTMMRHEITDKLTHPSYQCSTTNACDAFAGFDLDVGLVRLAEPIVDVPFYALDTTLPAIGDTCRTVGFGLYTVEGETNLDMATVKQKRVAEVKVIDVDDTYVLVEWVDGIADHGDSGGPLFCSSAGVDKLVGTTTMHTDGELQKHRQEYFTRVDRGLAWYRDTIAAWSPPDMAVAPDLAVAPPARHGGCSAAPGEVSPLALLALAFVVGRRRSKVDGLEDRRIEG